MPRKALEMGFFGVRNVFAVCGLLLCAVLLSSCRSELESMSWRDLSASLSPDGKLVATIDRRNVDAPALRVKPFDSAKAPVTLAENISPVMVPAFTPDSKYLFYFKRGGLHMLLMEVSVNGGAPVEAAVLRVSPQHLTCLKSATRLVFLCFMDGYFGFASTVKSYDLKTGVLHEYKELPCGMVESAALSGDGNTLVFTDGQKLWRLELETGVVSDISAKVPGLDRPVHLALSYDGALLCLRNGRLSSRDVGNETDNFFSPDTSKTQYKTVDKRVLELIDLKGDKPPRKILTATDARLVCFSPDAKNIAFLRDNKVCVFDLATARQSFAYCPRYEFGGFLEWFGNNMLVCREFADSRSDARLLLFKFPFDAKGEPVELNAGR